MISTGLDRGVSLALLVAVVALTVSGLGQQPALATTDSLGGILGGLAGAAGPMANPFFGGSMMGGGGAGGMAAQLANAGAAASAATGASSALTGGDAGLIGNSMRLAQGFAGGMTSGMGASMSDVGRNIGLGEGLTSGLAPGGASPFGPFAGGLGGINSMFGGGGLFKRSLANSMAASSAMAGNEMLGAGPMGASAASAASAASSSAAMGDATGAAVAMDPVSSVPAVVAGGAMAAANTMAANNALAAVASGSAMAESAAAGSMVGGRQALALDAMRNAQTESALAGSEMAAHGANNARSAALASNAYREAKLASARDRVNIAGTIQNSARISDAAIATHDAATKAEDSLLGSELAVDSAATVLDSDGAYIPPVTNSLLRSLPYGRLGLRNIIPKPLTHTSRGLPDVWLNGYPVNYNNIPLRAYPYGLGPAGLVSAGGAQAAFAASNGGFIMQPFTSNNGLVLNGMVFDPAYAYLTTNLNGVVGTSLAPILANGQLEAQDELAMANLLQMQQLNGVGMSSTYQGYGRLNPVPMITGSVTDANLMPTTTIGTTYPIGSTLVIEPRDSFFQDYNDNASSRQNFDERQQ